MQKERNNMAVFPLREGAATFVGAAKYPSMVMREESQRKSVVSAVLLVILAFQVVNLPGAFLSHSTTEIGIAVLGLGLCGAAFIFNALGRLTLVSILLITVVDLGCGLMLLTSPMGLDVADLPVFDVLIVSELIAVSLLPARSVFPVALSNILFILADILLQPRTPELKMVLTSNMAYNTLMQPVLLQIVVAVVAYIWVRSALLAIARADRAEEIAELRKREMERARELDLGTEHLSEILVRAANGDRTVRANLNNDNILWRVGNSINLLLTRLRRAGQVEKENLRLREEVIRLTATLFDTRRAVEQAGRPAQQTQQT
jgi:hypothetical protein